MLRWLVMAAATLLAGCLPLQEGATSSSLSFQAKIYCYDPAKQIPYTTAAGHCIGTDRQVTQSEYRQQEADYEARAAAVNARTVQQAPPAAQKPATPNDSTIYCCDPSREIAYGVRATS